MKYVGLLCMAAAVVAGGFLMAGGVGSAGEDLAALPSDDGHI